VKEDIVTRRSRLLIVAAVLLLGGLGTGAYFGWRHLRTPRQALVGGRTPETWLEELRSTDPAVGGAAAVALADLGKPALPVLLEARKDADLRAHRRAVRALVRLGGAAAPDLVSLLDRGGARVETVLVRMGPPALPALEKALGQAERAPAAARVLGGMGERARPAVPAVVGLLQDSGASEGSRAAAALALGQIGPEKTADSAPVKEGDPIVDALTAALSGPSRVRVQAARALGRIGPGARFAVGDLGRLTRDPDVEVASAGCEALGQIGGPPAVAPLVARLLKGDGASKHAALALARLGPAARLGVGPLLSVLKSDKDDGRFARAVLERMGAGAVPDLEAACKETDAGTRRNAADVLGLMGPRASAAVPTLVTMLADRQASVAMSAAQALVRIDPAKASPAVPVLVRLFADKDEKIASVATLVLADFGPQAHASIPDLLTALKSKDQKVVRRAAFVLGRIRLAPDKVVPTLRQALAGPAKSRPEVARALGRLGEGAKEAIPDLLMLLKQPEMRPSAALALMRIDPAKSAEPGQALADDLAGEAPARNAALAALQRMPRLPEGIVPALRPVLADRLTAREALRVLQIEPAAAQAVIPDLITLLSDSDGNLRQEAGWMLRAIGKPALPALKRALSSPAPVVRAAAAWTLDWSPLYPDAEVDPSFLLPLLEDKDELVRNMAAATIAGLGVRSRESIEAMLALLGSTEVELRRSAAIALRMIPGEQRNVVAPHLIESLFDPDEKVRQAAAWALGEMGKGTSDAVQEELAGALHDPSPGVRLAAAESLNRCGGAKVEELAPVLLALAREDGPVQRRDVLEVLFSVSPAKARELLPDLDADLRGETVVDRTRAGEWLVRLDAGRARAVVPFLVGILNGWDAEARYQAAVVLGRLGGRAKEAAPALLRRADLDEDGTVRDAARKALAKMK
jgi:HEAT repeat protein